MSALEAPVVFKLTSELAGILLFPPLFVWPLRSIQEEIC